MIIVVYKTFTHNEVFTIHLFSSSLLILLILASKEHPCVLALTERTKGNDAEAVFRTLEENQGYQEPSQAMRISTLQTMAYSPLIC